MVGPASRIPRSVNTFPTIPPFAYELTFHFTNQIGLDSKTHDRSDFKFDLKAALLFFL
jgi:hypothetical protein